MELQNSYSVVIIGGGPSGATAARELARGGVDVALIEKDLSFDKPCGGGLFVRAFDEFDIPKSLIKKYINTVEIVSPNKTKIPVDIRRHPLGVVHRQEFDAKLRDLALEAGADIISGKAHDIDTSNGKIFVHIHTKNGDTTIIADKVIAADGVNSRVRKILLESYPSRILTYYANTHNEGINLGLASDNVHEIREYYQNFISKSNLGNEMAKPKGYFIPYWREQILYKDGVFYVGDSASLVLPFTYEGIYYAMKSGRLAAQAILADKPEQYEEKWNEMYLRKFRFLRLLQTIFLHNNWLISKMTALYKISKL